MASRSEIESDIAQLEELRQRAIDGGQVQWLAWIEGRLARRKQELKDLPDS